MVSHCYIRGISADPAIQDRSNKLRRQGLQSRDGAKQLIRVIDDHVVLGCAGDAVVVLEDTQCPPTLLQYRTSPISGAVLTTVSSI